MKPLIGYAGYDRDQAGRVRLARDQRRALIVSTGVEIANRNGLISAIPAHIARDCTIATSITTVRAYFPKNGDLWLAIVQDPGVTPAVKQQAARLGIVA